MSGKVKRMYVVSLGEYAGISHRIRVLGDFSVHKSRAAAVRTQAEKQSELSSGDEYDVHPVVVVEGEPESNIRRALESVYSGQTLEDYRDENRNSEHPLDLFGEDDTEGEMTPLQEEIVCGTEKFLDEHDPEDLLDTGGDSRNEGDSL